MSAKGRVSLSPSLEAQLSAEKGGGAVDGRDAGSESWPPEPHKRIRFSVAGEAWDVPWGRHGEFGTAAYWVDQAISGGYVDDDAYETMDLKAATVWGLLHGHQVRAEAGDAFYEQVVKLLEDDPLPTAKAVEAVLRTPIAGVGRYRWPNRAANIHEALTRIAADAPPDEPGRRIIYFEGLTGVGSKTARLIEMGLKGLDAQVHVNDIWQRRALTPIGVFRDDWNHNRHYDRFEEAFLQYARHGNVPPAALGTCIWELARHADL